MRLPDTLLAPLEIGLNRYLASDPPALEECRRLAGRVLGLQLEDLGLGLQLRAHEGGIQVLAGAPAEADVELSGSSVAFGRMLLAEDAAANISASGIQISGDTGVAQEFMRLLKRVDFDLEEELSKLIGDVAAHQLGRFARGAGRWGRHVAETLELDAAEYLREETHDLVHRADVEKWQDEVDDLRAAADRLETRVRRLNGRLAQV